MEEIFEDLKAKIGVILERNDNLYKFNTLSTSEQLKKNSEMFGKCISLLNEQVQKITDSINKNSIRHLEIMEKLKTEKPKLTKSDGLFWTELTDEGDAHEEQYQKITIESSKKPEAKTEKPKSKKIGKSATKTTITEYKGANIELRLSKVTKLTEIPESMYLYDGDKKNKPGIYTRIGNSIILVPFPDVIDPNDPEASKNCTVKCRSETRERCQSKKFGSNCPYAHVGEQFRKIGSNYRSEVPRLGKHSFIREDCENAKYSDIKHILMNSLSDILFCNLWFEKNISELTVIQELEICS